MSISLVIDASMPSVQVGLLKSGEWLGFAESSNQALQEIFVQCKVLFEAASLEINEIGRFIYAEGPGSVLGIRIACMAIQIWNVHNVPVFAYNTLALASNELPDNCLIYTPSRKGYFFSQYKNTSMKEISEEDLEEFVDKKLLSDVYSLRSYSQFIGNYCELVKEVDAKLFRSVEYQKWTKERHKK